jgi:hypothetical protein
MSGLTTRSSSGRTFQLVAGGDYAVAAASVADAHVGAADVPWVIAGLTFVGRTVEAEGLFASRQSDLSAADIVAARFFLAVAACREGRHDKSRQLLTRNFAEARVAADLQSRFFAAQGLAFYRYAHGRLPSAELWAEAALKAAAGAAFAYGSVLALELLGHVQLSRGSVRAGFRHLGLARQRAEALGQGALLQAMDVSSTFYRTTYGLAGSAAATTAELEAALRRCQFEDSYTRASLTLELARADVLAGRLGAAKSRLETASELVYQIDNPELEIDHNLCLANLLRWRGEPHQALSLVRAARHRARQRPDLRSLLRILGLESQLLAELGRIVEQAALTPEIDSLTRRTGGLISRRIAARARGTAGVARPGEDLLGDLVDDVHQPGPLTLGRVVASGWLGFLPLALGIKPGERVLQFDVEPGSLTIIDQGNVVHLALGCSEFMRKLIMALSAGEASKEALTAHLWGRSYNPLRHDGLIYGLVAKTRRFDPVLAEWIEACEVGYRLRAGVRVATRSLRPRDADVPTPAPSPGLSGALDARMTAALNSRQVSIMGWLHDGEVLDPRTAMKRLAVSDATVSRDLAGLVNYGLACRVGKGRSTRYARSDSSSDAHGG